MLKFGYGGISYILLLLGISEWIISCGIEEIKKKICVGSDRIRRVGGGCLGLVFFFIEVFL